MGTSTNGLMGFIWIILPCMLLSVYCTKDKTNSNGWSSAVDDPSRFLIRVMGSIQRMDDQAQIRCGQVQVYASVPALNRRCRVAHEVFLTTTRGFRLPSDCFQHRLERRPLLKGRAYGDQRKCDLSRAVDEMFFHDSFHGTVSFNANDETPFICMKMVAVFSFSFWFLWAEKVICRESDRSQRIAFTKFISESNGDNLRCMYMSLGSTTLRESWAIKKFIMIG